MELGVFFSMTEALLTAEDVIVRVPDGVALAGVRLKVEPGMLVAVVGLGGAGKTTLLEVLAGMRRVDEGSVKRTGSGRMATLWALQASRSPARGTVAEHVWRKGPSGLTKQERLRRADEMLQRLGGDFRGKTNLADLSLRQRQLVELAAVLVQEPEILVMDEPTSSLGELEARRLFEFLAQWRKRGIAVVFSTRRLEEAQRWADRVLVLKDGRPAGTLEGDGITVAAMKKLQLGGGGEASVLFARRWVALGWVVLDVQGLRTRVHPHRKFGLDVRQGEMVGLFGLTGAGRSAALRALMGEEPPLAGEVWVNAERVKIRSVKQAAAAGLAWVAADKDKGVAEAGISGAQHWFARFWRKIAGGWGADGREALQRALKRLEIEQKSGDGAAPRGILTTLDRRIVALAKALDGGPRVLLLDRPTRGLKVNEKREVYRMLERLAWQGMAVVFVSDEVEEIRALADRVVVMQDGELMGVLEREEMAEEAIWSLASGRHRRLPAMLKR